MFKSLVKGIQTGHPCFVGALLFASIAYIAHQQHDDLLTTAMIGVSGLCVLLWVPLRDA